MKRRWIVSLLVGSVLAVVMGYLYSGYSRTQSDAELIDSELITVDSEYKLVFFGYAGCYHYCDPRLKEIDPIYEKIKQELDVKMLFIDISEETTLEAAEAFVKAVNKEFEAINPGSEDINALQKMFQDLYISKMPDGEYWHSGFLYLLKRCDESYRLVKVYVEFTQGDAVAADIKKITAP